MAIRTNKYAIILISLVGMLVAGGLAWRYWPEGGDPRLRAFVYTRPPVSIIFTSRSELTSFRSSAPNGTGFTYPGQPHWQAREGRLRLLTTRGEVQELTWNIMLPDGDRLIDVMSPSLALDGTKVIFAGRREKGHGRFRLYEIGVNGTGLRQLTGGPDDPGATALPPMRYPHKADEAWPATALLLTSFPHVWLPIHQAALLAGSPRLLSDVERRQTDYDDIDPIYLPNERIAFFSSRVPDLGRGHARRATHLWIMDADGSDKHPITANRNSDRWPTLLSSPVTIAFSQWSRNTEVITADLTDIVPHRTGMASATRPTDTWQGLRIMPNGDQFGMILKLTVPVWRPHELAREQIVFMTSLNYGKPDWNPDAPTGMTIALAPMNLVTNSSSALGHDQTLPRQTPGLVRFAPTHTADGRRLSLATPAPCPTDRLLVSAATSDSDRAEPNAGQFGIYLARAHWGGDPTRPAEAADLDLRLLFDDPELVDAEPVAVVPRPLKADWANLASPIKAKQKAQLQLADGSVYDGPVAEIINAQLFLPPQDNLLGQVTDAKERPILQEPPAGSIDHIRFFVSYRDRFDHPLLPRVEGGWKQLLKVPLIDKAGMIVRLPPGAPTVLAGFTSEGKVAQWTTPAKDSQGRQATFYAFAGDHYSGVRAGERGFCMGCHPGHTVVPPTGKPGR